MRRAQSAAAALPQGVQGRRKALDAVRIRVKHVLLRISTYLRRAGEGCQRGQLQHAVLEGVQLLLRRVARRWVTRQPRQRQYDAAAAGAADGLPCLARNLPRRLQILLRHLEIAFIQ